MNEIKMTINEQLRQLQLLMHRASSAQFGRMRNPHRGQGRVLALLRLKPEISQKELTYLLNMSKQAAAELIAKLEKSGYITREPSESDKRSMIIRLTDRGAEATDDVDGSLQGDERFLDCLNDEELAAFSEYLGRIIAQYEEQFPQEDFEQRRQMMEAFMMSHGRGFEHGGRPHPGRGFEERGRRPGRGFMGRGGHPEGPFEGHGHHPEGRPDWPVDHPFNRYGRPDEYPEERDFPPFMEGEDDYEDDQRDE